MNSYKRIVLCACVLVSVYSHVIKRSTPKDEVETKTPECTEEVDEKGFIKRTYGRTIWATTRTLATSSYEGSDNTFMKLFSYINKHKIDMTKPVLKKMEADGSGGIVMKEMYFYLDYKSKEEAPAPAADENVEIKEMGPSTVYVKRHDEELANPTEAFISMPRLTKEANESLKKLREELIQSNKIKGDEDGFVASYQSPWDTSKRYEAIIIVENNSEDTAQDQAGQEEV